ncbi:Uncharacterized protein Adt_41732 [Abeliophyllum distichum]|uniref:Uncharacterized protein n=1 Tax=Abeliophyllum distichum TaxID=126358 RepID=A0ABD1PTL9_9LAMI
MNILFGSTFDQMDVYHELTAISEPLFKFYGGIALFSRGMITLVVDFEELPCHLRKFMKFLIVDTRFCLPWSPRKARTEGFARKSRPYITCQLSSRCWKGSPRFVTIRQRLRACYMNALRKVTKHEDVALAVMTIHSEQMDVDYKEMDKEMILDEGLDPRIIGLDSLASPVEELEAFPVNSSEPSATIPSVVLVHTT